MSTTIKNISIVASGPSTHSAPKAAIFIAPKVTPKVTPITAPKVTQKTRFFIIALNISPAAALKVALKPAPKSKSIRALKPRAAAKSKLAKIIKYKDKTTKLYTFYTCSAKAPVIRSGQGIKFKSKLSKAIIPISGRKSLSFNNTNIEDNNKDKLIII